MKYFVVVNEKYIVNVESSSNGGAEHVVLDDLHYGIEQCQAFSMDELGTSTFRYFAEKCEMISLKELNEKCMMYKNAIEEKKSQEKQVAEYTALIKNLEEKLLQAKSYRNTYEINVKKLVNELETIF